MLLPAIFTFCQLNDETIQSCGLRHLEIVMQQTWARIPAHKESIEKGLNEAHKSIQECYHYSDSTKQKLSKRVEETRNILKMCIPERGK